MTAVQDAPAAEEQPAVEDQPAMEDQPALENQPALDDVTFPLPGYCRAPNTSNACMVYKTAQIILVCEYQTVEKCSYYLIIIIIFHHTHVCVRNI